MLWFCGILYAMRSGLSKFLVKILLRRVVSRSAIRGASSLLSLPVVAFWNSVLARTVMANVRTVALARSSLTLMIDSVLALHVELHRQMAAGVELQQAVDLARTRSHALDSPHVAFHPNDMSQELKEMIIRATAVAVVINREFHPNLEQIIKHLKTRFRIEPDSIENVDDFEARESPLLRVLGTRVAEMCMSDTGRMAAHGLDARASSSVRRAPRAGVREESGPARQAV